MWTWPLYIALLGGTMLSVAAFVPLVVWQVRRYGRISSARLLGAAAVAVYGVALVAYTLLPLPGGDLGAWCAQYGYDGLQTHPFQFVADISEDVADADSVTVALRRPAVLQAVLNVLLFVPWGVLVRGFLGRGRALTVLSAFAASLFIETVQFTGIFGLIPCSYRLGDVDDLFLNTSGGVLGMLVAPLVLRWMPTGRQLADQRLAPRPVTSWRRWCGMVADLMLFQVTAFGAQVTLSLLLDILGTDALTPSGQVVVSTLVAWGLIFVLPALSGHGGSPGQRLVWLAPVRAGTLGRPSWPRRLLRSQATGGLWALLVLLGETADGGLTFLSFLVAVLAFVCVIPTRGHRGLSGVVSGCDVADSRSLQPRGGVPAPDAQNGADQDQSPPPPSG